MTLILSTACATTPDADDSSSTKIDAESAKDFKLSSTKSKLTAGIVDYKHDSQSFKAQWFQCIAKPGLPFVAYFHGSNDANNPQSFCDDWNAQVLLKSGFNVIAVNRPSFKGSSGKDDLAGPQSVAANVAGIKAAVGQGTLVGLWGVDSGVIAAAFTAKTLSDIKWLLLGSGFYDLESIERTSKNDAVVKLIATLKSSEGEAALERRSIAWDIAGLPNRIAIYHSKNDDTAPKQQADDFNAQLRTSQAKVFYDEVDAPTGSLPWQAQYQIVEKALKQLKAK
jgi:hypothetical protein